MVFESSGRCSWLVKVMDLPYAIDRVRKHCNLPYSLTSLDNDGTLSPLCSAPWSVNTSATSTTAQPNFLIRANLSCGTRWFAAARVCQHIHSCRPHSHCLSPPTRDVGIVFSLLKELGKLRAPGKGPLDRIPARCVTPTISHPNQCDTPCN